MRYKVFDVFAQKPFEGNPTGIVYADRPLETELMQRLANELALRDTIFLLPKSRPELLFTSRTFTPNQELEICGQGLVGAIWSLLDDYEIPSGRHTVETAIGPRGVVVERGETTSVLCSLGKPVVTELPPEDRERIEKLLASRQIRSDRTAFVELGRKRLLAQVTPSELEQAELEPAAVVETCRALKVTGIVLCTTGSDLEPARSRHFTTSLKGTEDPVTGGAAAAILAFYRDADQRLEQLQVYQGGFSTRGGLMLARTDSSKGEVWIGGNAVKISEGEILL